MEKKAKSAKNCQELKPVSLWEGNSLETQGETTQHFSIQFSRHLETLILPNSHLWYVPFVSHLHEDVWEAQPLQQ